MHDLIRVLHVRSHMSRYIKGGEERTKTINLHDLDEDTDLEELVTELIETEVLITEKQREQLHTLLQRLVDKLLSNEKSKFYLFKKVSAHVLPLTNIGLNKSGTKFVTGSYDRTAKLWDTASGDMIHCFEGHDNVVYAVAFNVPFGDKVPTKDSEMLKLSFLHGSVGSVLCYVKRLLSWCAPSTPHHQCFCDHYLTYARNYYLLE